MIQEFGDNIKIDCKIGPFFPDYCYCIETLGLYVDIEIDEPYDFKTRLPIHYTQSTEDECRNSYFLDNNWSIIRFSEKQIIENPQECCDLVREVICYITNKDAEYISSAVEEDIQWTYEEAAIMAANRYREKYLNPI